MFDGVFASGSLIVLMALVIVGAGTRLTEIADRLADRTGFGEAVIGAALLGAVTSISGIVVSITAAADARPALSISNAMGGILTQTVFLVIADAVYTRANLEHAAASSQSLLQIAWLITLLAAGLFAAVGPDITIWAIHPVSFLLPLGYILSVQMAGRERVRPMWTPRHTSETRPDRPQKDSGGMRTLASLWTTFAILAVLMAAAGYILEKGAADVSDQTGIGDLAVGALLTATVTSLPELVTTVAAVRRGALTLALGGIIGGNTFDILFLSFSDVAYRQGSIFHAADGKQVYTFALAILMSSILLLGLLKRQRRGPANIGYDGISIIVIYVVGITGLVL